MLERQLYEQTCLDLIAEKSMIFLVGPRQVGKTTLSQMICQRFSNHHYFSWDILPHRSQLLENPLFFETLERRNPSPPLIVFDEIHKYGVWKNYLKSVYDQFHNSFRFLVSGSGRLDIYQRGGDSLAGRYFLFHLWPLTVAELGRRNRPIEDFLGDPLHCNLDGLQKTTEIWERLATLSGFPEPFLSDKLSTYRRWSEVYSRQLIREDIRDLTHVRNVGEMEALYLLLPSKVGSPLSVPSLARDLKVSYNTIKDWLDIFERFFLSFSLSPWTFKIARAIQKEKKVYIWDTPLIKNASARFENMVALELWRALTTWNDRGWGRFSLHFIKNKEQQEIDFLIADDREPLLLVEAKKEDTHPSGVLKKVQKTLDIPAVQLTETGEGFRKITNEDNSILIAPAHIWLSALP